MHILQSICVSLEWRWSQINRQIVRALLTASPPWERQTCKIEDTDSELDLNLEFKAAQCQQTFVVRATSFICRESRKNNIQQNYCFVWCVLYIVYSIIYIPRWNQLNSRREIALRMDCQALTCWMLMNGTCELHSFFFLAWTWMRAIGIVWYDILLFKYFGINT